MRKTRKSGHIGLLRRNVGHPRHVIDLRQGVRCLAVARPRCQNGIPWVRHGVATVH